MNLQITIYFPKSWTIAESVTWLEERFSVAEWYLQEIDKHTVVMYQ